MRGPQRFPDAFRAHRCLFVNVPGCESEAVYAALFGANSPGPVPLRWYEERFAPEFATSFKFAFVRDPLERAYVTWARWREARLFQAAESSASLDEEEDFDAFVEGLAPPDLQDRLDFRPQTDFLEDSQGRVRLDFIGHYESLMRDFQSMADFLCLPAVLPWSAPAYERTPRSSRYAVGPLARKRLRQLYQRDYEVLGYA